VLPEDEATWVHHTVDALVLRRCAYFRKMTGLPAITADSTTVRLPKTNVFSPDDLQAMMTEISRKGSL